MELYEFSEANPLKIAGKRPAPLTPKELLGFTITEAPYHRRMITLLVNIVNRYYL